MLHDEKSKITSINYVNKFFDVLTNQIEEPTSSSFLAANTTLRRLNLFSNYIKNKGAKNLATNTSLRSLDLSWNEIEDEGVAALSLNKSIRNLNLRENRLKNGEIVMMESFATPDYERLSHYINTVIKKLITKLFWQFRIKQGDSF